MAIFEEIGRRLTDAGNDVAKQTRNFTETARLNSAIADCEKKITQCYTAIGQSYYERHRDDPNAEELQKILEVRQLYQDIVQLRERVTQLKGITVCPNCGAQIPLHAVFCTACGSRVASQETQELAAQDETTQVCPSCQRVISKGNAFCNYCGAKIEQPYEE